MGPFRGRGGSGRLGTSRPGPAWTGTVERTKMANRVFTRVARAYVGWLLTNRFFLDEHDALFGGVECDGTSLGVRPTLEFFR